MARKKETQIGVDKPQLNFEELLASIRLVHNELAARASRAVNVSLTLRNWLIGMYVREYEQAGADRALYGSGLIDTLAGELQKSVDTCYSGRYIRLCRQFYQTYPQIRKSLISKLSVLPNRKSLISQMPIFLKNVNNSIVESASPQTLELASLIERLSFTHIIELLQCDDPIKRAFYEIESIRGEWSVRELKRQMASLYYERSGLSLDKAKLAELTQQGADQAKSKLPIRDPYIFEFLGLKPREVMSESDLEAQLLDKLEEFLLELGHGFCFEARQKRILIGDEHFFVDMVFYHRILKCHVLIELKLEKFSHENIGQLNTYVSWYRKNMMTRGDSPPVGILLCSKKDHALVEYALAGMDNNLFVSKYLLEMPKKEEIQRFIEKHLKGATNGY